MECTHYAILTTSYVKHLMRHLILTASTTRLHLRCSILYDRDLTFESVNVCRRCQTDVSVVPAAYIIITIGVVNYYVCSQYNSRLLLLSQAALIRIQISPCLALFNMSDEWYYSLNNYICYRCSFYLIKIHHLYGGVEFFSLPNFVQWISYQILVTNVNHA